MLNLHVVSPLFTGETPDEAAIPKRLALWVRWLQTDGYHDLRRKCERLSVTAYHPGTEIGIPHDEDPQRIRLIFPALAHARVPKGLIARLHLVVLLADVDKRRADPRDVVFACIDGSGAFEFDSLAFLLESFESNPSVDVVFGRRPDGNSGMERGRKEIEEFEQYLLFRYRQDCLRKSFQDYDLGARLLPDGQAGCWGFRLSAASQLPLTAGGYEIEYDLLASTVDAGLVASYTQPLLMSETPRHSLAAASPVSTSIGKLRFIERKLRIKRGDIANAWWTFKDEFGASELLKKIHPEYEPALLTYCES